MPSREASEAQEHMGKDTIRNGDSDSRLRTGQAIQPKEQWRHAEVCRLCGKAAWRPVRSLKAMSQPLSLPSGVPARRRKRCSTYATHP
jgi:hypothetical protein